MQRPVYLWILGMFKLDIYQQGIGGGLIKTWYQIFTCPCDDFRFLSNIILMKLAFHT